MSKIIRHKTRVAKIPEGEHLATIDCIELRYDVPTPFGIKDQIEVGYRIGDEVLKKTYTQSLYEKSSFSQVVLATMGTPPPVGEDFDVDSLLDLSCKVTVEHRTAETGSVWETVVQVASASDQGRN